MRTIIHGIIGILIGSFCYLMVLMGGVNNFTTSRFSIITILVASFLTGVVSQMIGNEKISASLTYAIHFVLTSIIFLVTFYVNGWITNWKDLLFLMINFLIIYTLVWLGIIIWNKINANEINKQLKQMNRK